jgi:hypothetical protein
MTEAEIMKALELCGKRSNGCADCPYFGIGGHDKLNRDILDLINRKNAEIEKRDKEIDKWQKVNFDLCNAGGKLLHERKTIRQKAIKEFAERVIDLFPSDFSYTTISRFTIRKIAKEMGVEL